MKSLESNKDLYDYLKNLSALLKNREAVTLSDVVNSVITQAYTVSTEFLGESRIALRRVRDEENGILNKNERLDLMQVIKQLDDVFGNRA